MDPDLVFSPSKCALCETFGNAAEIFHANFSTQSFNPETFSARRLPDKIHYRIVKCNTCGLVRSDPIVEQAILAKLYKESRQTYDAEVKNLEITYSRYLERLDRYLSHKGHLLEIGCGNGFLLSRALQEGYEDVTGIEPSQEAVSKSAPEIQPKIVCDVFRPDIFPPQQFDVVCMFQVFDHIADPNHLIQDCFSVLKPGGLILFLNHDVASLSARILGESSPIFDIEHTYLYSLQTLTKLLIQNNFEVKESGPALNTYSLRYLVHLFPFPISMKSTLLASLSKNRLGNLKLNVPLGNLYLIAQKSL
jgi:SAM-dependent methyltransferase